MDTLAELKSPALIITLIHLIPIGVFGLMRYSTWAFRRLLSSQWRDIKAKGPLPYHTVGAAVTVKGEPVETFQEVLNALLSEKFDQVNIVFDAKEKDNIAMTRQFAADHAHEIDIRMAITTKKGKRNGLAQAINLAQGMDIIMCMDSDTLISRGVKQAILETFSNPTVGGVTVAQRVYRPHKLVHYLFDIRLKLRYLEDIPGQALGGRISCLSGRCSAYLAEPLKTVGPGLLDEKWLGIRKTGGGDDKYLTTAIHDLGYKTVVITGKTVYTRPQDSAKVYFNQSLRWARNSWFSDLRALCTRKWMWQSPILLFYTLDRMVGSFTVLLAFWYMILLLVTQSWAAALILFIWWNVTRTIKIWPYLWETKKFHLILPYLFFTLVLAWLKIHALITLWESGWLTRGAKQAQALFKRALNFTYSSITTSVILALGGVVLLINQIWLADLPVIAEIGNFYRPGDDGLVIEDNLIVSDATTIIVIEDNPSPAVLNVAAQTALRLKDEFAESRGKIQVVWTSQLSKEQARSANLLFIGKPRGTGPIVEKVVDLYENPQLGESLADAEPFAAPQNDPIRVVESPWNAKHFLMLVSTTEDTMYFRLLGKTVREDEAVDIISENLGRQFVLETNPSGYSADSTATLAGWDIRETAESPDGAISRTYGLTFPLGLSIASGVAVHIETPRAILPQGAKLEIRVNGTLIGTVDAVNTMPTSLHISAHTINQDLGRPENKRLITVTLLLRSVSEHIHLDATPELWQWLDQNIKVSLPVRAISPHLAAFPYPYTFNNQATPVIIVLPQQVTELDVQLLIQLVARLGSGGPNSPSILVVNPDELDTEVMGEANLIFLGELERQPFSFNLHTSMLENFGESIFNRMPNDQTGLLYMVESPWNPARTMLLVTSETLLGYEVAALALIENRPLTLENSHAAFINPDLAVQPLTDEQLIGYSE